MPIGILGLVSISLQIYEQNSKLRTSGDKEAFIAHMWICSTI